jgi:hypothetical protein
MKNLWQKFVAWLKAVVLPWLKGLWLKFKTWFLGQELAWIKKNWKEIVNFLVILFAYWKLKADKDVVLALVLKVWLIAMILYYVLIQGLGIQILFKKAPPTTPTA